LATLVGSALRASAKDRCLRHLQGYHVTAERCQPADVLRRSEPNHQAANQALRAIPLGREPLSDAAQRLAETLAKRQDQKVRSKKQTPWEGERL
jgi:hypothetical protein